MEIRVDGEPVDIDGVPAQQTVEDWAAFDPDAVPLDAVGHYLSGGALHTVTDGRAGARTGRAPGAYGLSSAAVSADPRTGELSFLAGVRSDAGGATLFAGPYDGELARRAHRRDAQRAHASRRPGRRPGWCATAPTWSACRPAAAPQAVSAPTLHRARPRRRAAAVAGRRPRGAGRGRARPAAASTSGTVVRAEDGSVELRDLRDDRPVAVPGRRRRVAGQRQPARARRRRSARTGSCPTRSASTAGA